MEKVLDKMLPVMAVEHDCILSKKGDITVVYKVELPELFTLSAQEYEALHFTWIRALRALPKYTVFCKQDWYVATKYPPDFSGEPGFIAAGSERHFNERPFLDHSCYILLTKKPQDRKPSGSLFSTLVRPVLVPEQTLSQTLLQDFLDGCGQFAAILEASGFIKLERLSDAQLASSIDGRPG